MNKADYERLSGYPLQQTDYDDGVPLTIDDSQYQRLQRENAELQAELVRLTAERALAVRALEFYATGTNWEADYADEVWFIEDTPAVIDGGAMAAKALRELQADSAEGGEQDAAGYDYE